MLLSIAGFLAIVFAVYIVMLILQTAAFWAIVGIAGALYWINICYEFSIENEFEAALVSGSIALLFFCIIVKAIQTESK